MTTTMSEGDPKCNEEAIVAIADLLREEVDRRFALEGDYAERERVMHEVGNEVLRLVQEQDLQTLADRFDTAEVVFGGHVYRRHEEASPRYHGLSGPLTVRRWTYRQAGVHNGPTIVPLDLAAGLIERATPATASAFLTGEADTHSRELREHLLSSLRVPPSRTTIERVVHRAATKLREQLPLIEPVLRIAERVPEGTVAMSTGLDRTSLPMEEKLAPEEVSERRRKARKKPYERKPPEPVEVNYRMAYVGTVSFLDVDGRPLRTLRYFASAGTPSARGRSCRCASSRTPRPRCGTSSAPD